MHCSNKIAILVVLFDSKIVPCVQVTAFCSLLPILDPFLLVLLKTHTAHVVKGSESTLGMRIAKINRLAKEVDALGLVHWKPILPKTIIHR